MQNHQSAEASDNEKLPQAPTGNASNPTATDATGLASGENQLLDKRAEKYLREVASIEDLPDDEDQQQADKTLKGEEENQ